jgi:EpsI family protein
MSVQDEGRVVRDPELETGHTATRRPVRAAIVAAAFAATYLFTHVSAPAASVAPPSFAGLPLELAPWTGAPAPALDPDVAELLAADEYVRRYYTGPQGTLEMDISYYTQPRVGTTMHSPLNCLPGNGWEVTSVNTRQLATSVGVVAVRELTVQRGQTKYALTYWVQSRDRIIADEFSARFHLLGDAIRRRPTDASLVRVMMPAAGSGREEQATLAEFAGRLIPEIAGRHGKAG